MAFPVDLLLLAATTALVAKVFVELTFLADSDLGAMIIWGAQLRGDLLPNELAGLAREDLLALRVTSAPHLARVRINLAIDDVWRDARLIRTRRQYLTRRALLDVGARLALGLVDNVYAVRAGGSDRDSGGLQHLTKKACEKSDSGRYRSRLKFRLLFSSYITYM